jgi:hypothetical protein
VLIFPEYFHADNGAGLGAWHQTGWTALVLDLIIAHRSAGAMPPREPPGASARRRVWPEIQAVIAVPAA